MEEVKFRLVYENKVVGYESHVIDPDTGCITIYHKKPHESMKYGYPITLGYKYYIDHDEKDLFSGVCDKHYNEIYSGDRIMIDRSLLKDDEPDEWEVCYLESFRSFAVLFDGRVKLFADMFHYSELILEDEEELNSIEYIPSIELVGSIREENIVQKSITHNLQRWRLAKVLIDQPECYEHYVSRRVQEHTLGCFSSLNHCNQIVKSPEG